MTNRRVGSALLILLGATACAAPAESAGPSASTGVSSTSESEGAAPATTPLDGTYQTSFTRDELAAATTETEEVNDQNWGDFTLTFSGGEVTFTQENEADSYTTSGVFTVEGDTVTLAFDTGGNAGETFGFRWSLDGDTLTFERDESIGPGPTPYVVKPWTSSTP